MEHWHGIIEFEDGETLEKDYPYTANGNYSAECREQYDCECDLIESNYGSEHGAIIFYSVGYEE